MLAPMLAKGVIACVADKTKPLFSPSANQRRNSCSGLPTAYQDLSTHHDWPVKKCHCAMTCHWFFLAEAISRDLEPEGSSRPT